MSGWLSSGPPKATRPDHATSFSEIRVGNGTIVVKDQARGVAETLSDVELALAWPSISKSFAATGRFAWHGEPVDATFAVTDFAAALVGDRTGIKLRLSGAPLKAAAEYALVSDRAARGGDPRIVLEYAETLIATGARDDAARQLYALLAREQGWLSREDTLGHPKSAEDHARDREAVQRAHLLLGSLLGQPAEAKP